MHHIPSCLEHSGPPTSSCSVIGKGVSRQERVFSNYHSVIIHFLTASRCSVLYFSFDTATATQQKVVGGGTDEHRLMKAITRWESETNGMVLNRYIDSRLDPTPRIMRASVKSQVSQCYRYSCHDIAIALFAHPRKIFFVFPTLWCME
jgi:hypothetical protein